jgi:serine/threonine protein kinase
LQASLIDDRFAVIRSERERRGGTAVVYKAIDTHAGGRPVAVKVFESAGISDELLYEIFLRETDSLTLLKHESIVEMVARGRDERLGRYYVVLEWIEDTLQNVTRRQAPEGWDSFADPVLLPILNALAFAHRRGVLHRDVKPSNILIGAEGNPRLADFGLAKILHSLREGQTLQEFRTLPYSPPEHGSAPASARADLFSLGVTALSCLAPHFSITHANIPDAIAEANVPPSAEEFLRRLTTRDPADRPFNAEVALTEYRELSHARPRNIGALPRYYLLLPRATVDRAAVALDISAPPDGDALRRRIADDLNHRASFRLKESSRRDKGDAYSLLGDQLSYTVAPATNDPTRLSLLDVQNLPASQLEYLREKHTPVEGIFTFDPPLHASRAQDARLALLVRAAEFANEQRVLTREREESELFRKWRDLLDANEEAELLASKALDYDSFIREGENIRFRLRQTVSENEIGLGKLVYTSDRSKAGRKTIAGVVEDAQDKELVLHITRGDRSRIPARGALLPDFSPSRVALGRQRRALDAVQHEGALRPELRRLLLNPAEAATPITDDLPELFQPDLDEPKREALRVALNAPDLTAVQGPPGTGKTTWIAELVCQFLRQKRGRILLSGQTHIAVDNALERIQRLSPEDIKIIRVGPAEKIGEQTGAYRIEAQMEAWRTQVRRRAEAWLAQRIADMGILPDQYRLNTRAEALDAAERALDNVHEELEYLRDRETAIRAATTDTMHENGSPNPDDELTRSTQESATIQQQIAEAEETEEELSRRVETAREELASALGDPALRDAPPASLRDAVLPHLETIGKHAAELEALQVLQAEWFQRFGVGPGFREALLVTADVVAGTCIGVAQTGLNDIEFDLVVIDEASKATPTEALVPMVRGKRWVLVGDQKQLPPFVDDDLKQYGLMEKYSLTPENLRTTLFDRLVNEEGLPEVCRPKLTTQHRMHPAIGHLISDCFYGGKLTSARTDGMHPAVARVLSRPVTWFSTSSLQNRHEQVGRGTGAGADSYVNPEEAARIHRWLTRLEQSARERTTQSGAPALRVGVISGYAAQKAYLMREIAPRDRKRWAVLDIEINSVDAFQGREVDVLVYSVTRSNGQGRLGFVRLPHRLNVALSRGRDALVIFGDAAHCRRSFESDNAFPRVLDHITSFRHECTLEVLR